MRAIRVLKKTHGSYHLVKVLSSSKIEILLIIDIFTFCDAMAVNFASRTY